MRKLKQRRRAERKKHEEYQVMSPLLTANEQKWSEPPSDDFFPLFGQSEALERHVDIPEATKSGFSYAKVAR